MSSPSKEIIAALNIPVGVDEILESRISKKLRKAGIYFHCFRRIKTKESLAHKYTIKNYGESNKIQDYVGLKFVFYFVEDMEIAREILDDCYDIPDSCKGKGLNWSISEQKENEFSPTKINGVFKIPSDVLSEEEMSSWDACFVDHTFEVQLKTMLFQSWHEIEHDLKYKHRTLWDGFPEMERKLNSVLAALELCDDSVINILEKLSYLNYHKAKLLWRVGHDEMSVDDAEREAASKGFELVPENKQDVKNPGEKQDENYEGGKQPHIEEPEWYLERIAHTHYRIRMLSAEQAFSERIKYLKKKDKTEELQTLMNNLSNVNAGYDLFLEYFTWKLGNPDLGKRVAKRFDTPLFLKHIIKYDRNDLLRKLISYRNDVPIHVFNICAIVYLNYTVPLARKLSEKRTEKPEHVTDEESVLVLDEELIFALKRYLRRERTDRIFNYIPTPVVRTKKYTTYQCCMDIYPASEELDTEQVFKKSFLYVARWMGERVGKESLALEDLKPLRDLCNIKRDSYGELNLDGDIEYKPEAAFDLRIFYYKKQESCVFRIIEPDNRYEIQTESFMPDMQFNNRQFISEVSLKRQDDRVLLAVRCRCKEPMKNRIPAEAFRPGFLRRMFEDTDFTITEHGVDRAFAWSAYRKDRLPYGCAQDVAEFCKLAADELLLNENRQVPVLLVPECVSDDPDVNLNKNAVSHFGYAHMLVLSDEEIEELVRKRLNSKFMAKQLKNNNLLFFTDMENAEEEANVIRPESEDEVDTYIYAITDTFDRTRNYPIGKEYKFGGCKFYRDLRNDFYKNV